MISSLLILLIGILFKLFPPKKINSFWGYRTAASKTNAKTWRFAQDYFATWFVRVTLVLCLLALIIYENTGSLHITELIICPLIVCATIFVMLRTEHVLKKYGPRL